MQFFVCFGANASILMLVLGAISACSKPSAPVRTRTHVDRINPEPVTERDRLPSSSGERSQTNQVTTSTSRFQPRTMDSLASEGQLNATIMVPSPLASLNKTSLNKAPWRVVFAAHGAGGRGVDHCEYWDKILADDVLIVCPTGTLLRKNNEQEGAYFQSHLALRKELDALSIALRTRFGERLVEGDWLYLGYSQGATMGALALLEEVPLVGKHGFSQVVLVEGGGENWNVSRSQKFKAKGGTSVALVCGTAGCGRHGRGNIPHLKQAGLTASLIEIEGGGHAYWGPMTEGVRSALLQAGYVK